MKFTDHIRQLYIHRRWYITAACCACCFIASFFIEFLFEAAFAATLFWVLLTLLDFYLIFLRKEKLYAFRIMPLRFSMGDYNEVSIKCFNRFPYPVTVDIIEQLPEQFQQRAFRRTVSLKALEQSVIRYNLRPLERGAYHFGALLCYVRSPVGLLERRIETDNEKTVKVYPSFQQLRKFELMSTTLQRSGGVRKIRRVGQSMEFEKIKNYVPGDDIRTVNWKATARTGSLMVNTYADAKEQQVYAVIDKGRSMKMPFDGMTLLDYAINATLSLLNIALLRHDKAGLITFPGSSGNIIPAEKRQGQLLHITEALYKQQTDFKESDYEALLNLLYRKIGQRSFLVLFTNFETRSSLERQLPYLKALSSRHLVCVVFFQNTLLREIQESQPDTTEGIYIKTIAERFDFEKKQIVKELRRHGIIALLTTPGELSVNVINKYLELKARRMI